VCSANTIKKLSIDTGEEVEGFPPQYLFGGGWPADIAQVVHPDLAADKRRLVVLDSGGNIVQACDDTVPGLTGDELCQPATLVTANTYKGQANIGSYSFFGIDVLPDPGGPFVLPFTIIGAASGAIGWVSSSNSYIGAFASTGSNGSPDLDPRDVYYDAPRDMVIISEVSTNFTPPPAAPSSAPLRSPPQPPPYSSTRSVRPTRTLARGSTWARWARIPATTPRRWPLTSSLARTPSRVRSRFLELWLRAMMLS
jgi:hypothetical protein